jgi:hypothetical protein
LKNGVNQGTGVSTIRLINKSDPTTPPLSLLRPDGGLFSPACSAIRSTPDATSQAGRQHARAGEQKDQGPGERTSVTSTRPDPTNFLVWGTETLPPPSWRITPWIHRPGQSGARTASFLWETGIEHLTGFMCTTSPHQVNRRPPVTQSFGAASWWWDGQRGRPTPGEATSRACFHRCYTQQELNSQTSKRPDRHHCGSWASLSDERRDVAIDVF